MEGMLPPLSMDGAKVVDKTRFTMSGKNINGSLTEEL